MSRALRPDSRTETFAALKLFIDNWRWQDVPFYLRTGKRLPVRVSEITIQFRPVPHKSFPVSAALLWQPNRLIIRIQPEEGILIRFQAKQPGGSIRLSPVDMLFSYEETFRTEPPEAYETLLLDVMCRRRDPFHAGRPGRGGLVRPHADPARVGVGPAGRISQLRGGKLGPGVIRGLDRQGWPELAYAQPPGQEGMP